MGNGLSDDLDINFGADDESIDSVSLPDMANCRMALRSSVTFSFTEYKSPKCWVIKAQASLVLRLPVVSISCESAAACVAKRYFSRSFRRFSSALQRAINRSIWATMRCCSSSGGSGIGISTNLAMETPPMIPVIAAVNDARKTGDR